MRLPYGTKCAGAWCRAWPTTNDLIFINIQGKGIGRYRLSEIKFDKQEKIEIEKRQSCCNYIEEN